MIVFTHTMGVTGGMGNLRSDDSITPSQVMKRIKEDPDDRQERAVPSKKQNTKRNVSLRRRSKQRGVDRSGFM